ncbi:Alanine--tRNA ligase [Candidatus Cyrtobacter comes]|uniref:Alanine--tRNA ligase n=1 Tax=Candidatus Cyrtobacter comes TaxID=675776 RepID=A0ABU5L7R1_9RICK|nr:Alanine--tRNA ligase [Candidatus Cyrtobacter comes]
MIVESSPLIPHNDPSLMFVNSGMVQFKNYFTGLDKPQFSKVTTSQKCVRAGGKHNDLENVGYTARHHTFFEMLGNFAFQGAYFKEQAILLAWNFLIQELNLNKEKLYVTVFSEDNEAKTIWKKVSGFSDNKIIDISTSDNFWSMGDTGPCGPCSEIFYDHGNKYEGGLPGSINQDGDRYIEIWNIVFMQYNQDINGKREVLPNPAIDTGMGLERISAVMQGVNSNYEIDLFKRLIDASYSIIKNKLGSPSHRVIADHLRSSVFLIADGILPSNEGRGYVLRRIIRRAMRHVHSLGYEGNILSALSNILIEEMHRAYPEIKRAQALIESTLHDEEERFSETLSRGMRIIEGEISKISSGGILSGDKAFLLYDTYGFPLDLTKDFLLQHNISVDEKRFEEAMLEQKQRSSWKGSGESMQDKIWFEYSLVPTNFCGYERYECTADILGIVKDGVRVESAQGGEVFIIFNQTPFYAESGGQVADTGVAGIHSVLDVQNGGNDLFIHKVLLHDSVMIGDVLNLHVDIKRRNKIKANHSATHILHKALKDILGQHVVQKGSLVNESKLRFDFAHNSKLPEGVILQIEKVVNEHIVANCQVSIDFMQKQKAIERGAQALFGEKYGDEVRVIAMGDSIELCGGTHVNRTGDIGLFKIVSEEAIASGIRRIEALTGEIAFEFLSNKSSSIKKIADFLKTKEEGLLDEIKNLKQKNGILENELSIFKIKQLYATASFEKLNHVYFTIIETDQFIDLKLALDHMRSKDSIVVLLIKDSTMCIFSYSALVSAADVLGECIKNTAGKGGGSKLMAQAGGFSISDNHWIKENIKKIICKIEEKKK